MSILLRCPQLPGCALVQVQKLEALQAKQAAVLRRKTEEAEAARRRLKVLIQCSPDNHRF